MSIIGTSPRTVEALVALPELPTDARTKGLLLCDMHPDAIAVFSGPHDAHVWEAVWFDGKWHKQHASRS